jgi:hypothetical protein
MFHPTLEKPNIIRDHHSWFGAHGVDSRGYHDPTEGMKGARFFIQCLDGHIKFEINGAFVGGMASKWTDLAVERLIIVKTTTDGKEIQFSADDLIVYIQMFLPETEEWKEAMIDETRSCGHITATATAAALQCYPMRKQVVEYFERHFCKNVGNLQKTIVNVYRYLEYMEKHGNMKI